jgi:hypothetical protein
MYARAFSERVKFYQFHDWILNDIEKAKYSIDDDFEFKKSPRKP